MIDGNKKKINMVIPLNKPVMPDGEFTMEEDPVVTVRLSKIPAALAEKNKEIIKKMARYI